jgi:hypothetical protein
MRLSDTISAPLTPTNSSPLVCCDLNGDHPLHNTNYTCLSYDHREQLLIHGDAVTAQVFDQHHLLDMEITVPSSSFSFIIIINNILFFFLTSSQPLFGLRSRSGKLRLTLKIDPSFVRFTRWSDTPQTGMTTLLFTAEPASTVMRLLDFGEASSGGLLTRLPVEASAAVNTSSLSLTFGHFNDSFLFDPGMCLFPLIVRRATGGTKQTHPDGCDAILMLRDQTSDCWWAGRRAVEAMTMWASSWEWLWPWQWQWRSWAW